MLAREVRALATLKLEYILSFDVIIGLGVSGVFGVFGWLANRVWSGHRYEITNMKNTTSLQAALLQDHIEADRETHQKLLTDVGFIRGWIEGQQRGDHDHPSD